jgi:Flp pilus assembly pilin Flp
MNIHPTHHLAEHGQTMAEYAMILALIVAVVLVVIPTFGAATLDLFTKVHDAFGS